MKYVMNMDIRIYQILNLKYKNQWALYQKIKKSYLKNNK